MRYAFLVLLLTPVALRAEAPKPAPTRADEPLAKNFSPAKGAEFLDGVSLAWTRERKCATCHTNVPFMLARPHLRVGDPSAMQEVRSFLEKRAADWETDKPRTDYEVLTTAMALAGNDAAAAARLNPLTRKALDWSWRLQKEDGSWKWPKCNWPPMEHDDYYGVVFMAVAVGIAPDGYAKTELAEKGLAKVRDYLKKHAAPDLHHRTMLLWASTKLGSLLSGDEQKAIVQELLAKQRPDGGWCLPSLGSYKRRDDTPNDPNAPSDGYATGFVIYVLRQSGVPAHDPAIQNGVKWLLGNQRESGRWFTRSPSHDKAHYITNAGSAFAILALAACEVPLKEEK